MILLQCGDKLHNISRNSMKSTIFWDMKSSMNHLVCLLINTQKIGFSVLDRIISISNQCTSKLLVRFVNMTQNVLSSMKLHFSISWEVDLILILETLNMKHCLITSIVEWTIKKAVLLLVFFVTFLIQLLSMPKRKIFNQWELEEFSLNLELWLTQPRVQMS